jgi:hypothetical protein
MKKKVSHTEQHEWIRVQAWFDDFSIKVGMTTSFGGTKVSFSYDPKHDAIMSGGKLQKRLFHAFKKHLEGSNGKNLGLKMKSLAVLAEESSFLAFINKLENK